MFQQKNLLSRLGVLAIALAGAAGGLCFGLLVAAGFENALAQWDAAAQRSATAEVGAVAGPHDAALGTTAATAPWLGMLLYAGPPFVGAAFSLGLLGWVLSATRQRCAVAAIRALGGQVVHGDGVSPKSPWAHFAEDSFVSVRSVHLDGIAIGDADLAWLRSLPRLRHLWLADTAITDAAMTHVGRLRRLESLDLSGTAVTDAGLEQLCRNKRLGRLWLLNTQVTTVGLEALKQLPRLETVELDPEIAAKAAATAG
jgi:hypothetical protein